MRRRLHAQGDMKAQRGNYALEILYVDIYKPKWRLTSHENSGPAHAHMSRRTRDMESIVGDASLANFKPSKIMCRRAKLTSRRLW
jgi:hypothetical protein